MTTPDLFLTIFAAVASGNLLFAVIIWGFIQYSRMERDGTAGTRGSFGPLMCIVLPLIFLSLLTMVALDKVPAWLDYIAQ